MQNGDRLSVILLFNTLMTPTAFKVSVFGGLFCPNERK